MSVIPNWCNHSMLVEGSPEDLANFKQTMEVPDKWGNPTVLSEEPLIPYPEEFKELDRTKEEREKVWQQKYDTDGVDKMSKQNQEKWLKDNPYVKDGYNSGGFKWEQENYGTKWGFVNASIVGETENSISYIFDTAWSPANKLYELMGQKFPNLKFTIDYEEPGMEFAGTYDIHGTDFSHMDRPVEERCPECGETLDDCTCERCPDCNQLIDAPSSYEQCNCDAKREREEQTKKWEERWHRKGLADPNLDYSKLMKFAGVKKRAGIDFDHVEYKGKVYVIDFYEEGGHNLITFTVNEVDPETGDDIREVYSANDFETYQQLVDDGFYDYRKPEEFIKYLDSIGALDKPVSETEKWEERLHRKGELQKKAISREWKIYGLDVWGNEEDGFDVNDKYLINTLTFDIDTISDEQFIVLLIEKGILREGVTTNDVDIEWNDADIFIDEAKNGRPVVALSRDLDESEMQGGNKSSEKTRKWEERWQRRGGLKQIAWNRELSQNEIEESYRDYKVVYLKIYPSKKQGVIGIDFKHAKDFVDKFSIYDDGTIAFDHWMPKIMHKEISDYIRNELAGMPKQTPEEMFRNRKQRIGADESVIVEADGLMF